MPLPSSGTINLSDVIEEFGIGTNNSVNLITTASSGTVTAPVTGFVVIEVLGAGGGGGGGDGSFAGGGGGSGAWAKELVYINAGETLNYVVGLGGSFGEGPGGPINGSQGDPSYVYSGTKSITTIYCDGGFGGTTAVGVHGTGGAGGSNSNANTNIGLSYVGNGGLDGDLSPANSGISPEQISGATNAGNGGAGLTVNGYSGQNGAVKFTWYETTKNLRGHLKSANTNVPDFTSNSTVPTSGTVELRDFLGGSAVGFTTNLLNVVTDCGSSGLNNSGTAKLIFHANGRYDLDGAINVGSGGSVIEALNQQWCTANGNGGFEPRRFYVSFFKTAGLDDFESGSSSVNTYIALSSGGSPTWNLFSVAQDGYIEGNLCISTTNSNTGIVAFANVNIEVIAAGSN